MTVGELKMLLNELDDEMICRIRVGDVFFPICYQDTCEAAVPMKEGIDEIMFMLCPCYGHDEIHEDFHADLDEIIPN